MSAQRPMSARTMRGLADDTRACVDCGQRARTTRCEPCQERAQETQRMAAAKAEQDWQRGHDLADRVLPGLLVR